MTIAQTYSPASIAVVADEISTLWDVVVQAQWPDHPQTQYIDELSQDSSMRSAMNLQALNRLRIALEKTPACAAPTDPIMLKASDAILLARLVLKRLA